MTLNSSGPISLGGTATNASINVELSQAATAQISMNDTNVRTLAGVASGAITMPTNFYGKSAGATVNFIDVSVIATSSGGASAGYRVNPNGFDYQSVNGTFTSLSQWVTPTSAGGNYEILATIVSGSVSSGTIGSWVATSGTPLWVRSQPTVGTSIVELSMQVRATGTGTVLDTWSVTLEAERF
jgi:hypothetical protein